MKITHVEAIILKQETIELIGDGSQDTVLIRVETDEGITGIGEVDSNPYVVRQIIESPASHMACRGLREILIGENPLEVEKLWLKMYQQSLYYGRRSVGLHAISGIDIALWDICGQYYGVSVATLLGGRYREKIPAYCSVLMPPDRDGIAALIDRHMPKGYTGLKFGWGALGQDSRTDIALATAARELLGPSADLMLDIGMLWTDVKAAEQTCAVFADLDVFWVEEPFSPDRQASMAELRSRIKIRLAAGEELGGMPEFRDLVGQRCVDVLQPDLSRCGGLTIARKLIDLAQPDGLMIVPHAFKTGILTAASLQFIAALPEARFLEHCEQDTPLRQELTDTIFRVDKDGLVAIPDRPGLGIQVNADVVAHYRIK